MTLTISRIIQLLTTAQAELGDIPVVLYDLDTTNYYSIAAANLEIQQMTDGYMRVSIGVNDFNDDGEPEPGQRPLPWPTQTAHGGDRSPATKRQKAAGLYAPAHCKQQAKDTTPP